MAFPIAPGLSPNTQPDDIAVTFGAILRPWNYFSGDSIGKLEQWFRNYFSMSYAISFNSGRSAFYSLLKAMEIGEKDEVLLQAFTCVAVPNAIIWAGAKPVYVDVLFDGTINPDTIEKNITSKTKAILVQHTFGIPSQMDQIKKIAKKHNLLIIEDCAHTVGGTYDGKKLGTFGDAAFFSFGRDKAFSSVFGGMAITNDKTLGNTLRQFQKKQEYPGFFWIFQQLLHPLAFGIILPFYTVLSLGKVILVVLQRLHLLSMPVTIGEKRSNRSELFVRKMPNALCILALSQLRKIAEYNKKRIQISTQYQKELAGSSFELPSTQEIPYLRFPILCHHREDLLELFKKNNIYLGTWYANIIDPKGVQFEKIHFYPALTPQARHLAVTIVNLPTYPRMSTQDVKKIVSLLQSYAKSSRYIK